MRVLGCCGIVDEICKFGNGPVSRSLANLPHQSLALSLLEPALESSAAAMSKTPAKTAMTNEAPEPPAGVTFPAAYVAKRCRRCGIWSTSPAKYDQSKAPEAAWGLVAAWARGTLHQPAGNVCLICKKAWMGINYW